VECSDNRRQGKYYSKITACNSYWYCTRTGGSLKGYHYTYSTTVVPQRMMIVCFLSFLNNKKKISFATILIVWIENLSDVLYCMCGKNTSTNNSFDISYGIKGYIAQGRNSKKNPVLVLIWDLRNKKIT
jgi:hypothetical protein